MAKHHGCQKIQGSQWRLFASVREVWLELWVRRSGSWKFDGWGSGVGDMHICASLVRVSLQFPSLTWLLSSSRRCHRLHACLREWQVNLYTCNCMTVDRLPKGHKTSDIAETVSSSNTGGARPSDWRINQRLFILASTALSCTKYRIQSIISLRK